MRVRYRATWLQLVPMWLVVGTYLVVLKGPPDPLVAAVAVAVAFASMTAARYAGAALTPESVTVYRWGQRVIPWSRVDAVERVRMLGGNGVRLVVDGRRVVLPSPAHTPLLAHDPRFEEKAATVERYWRDARGGTA